MRGPHPLLFSLVWSTTTTAPPRGPIYFPEGLPLSPLSLLSRRRSCAAHTRPAVLPTEFAVRFFNSLRVSQSSEIVRLHIFKVVRFFSFPSRLPERERNSCGIACTRIEAGGVQPLLRARVREGFTRDMCTTWVETEDPPAAAPADWD